mgnify:CR=1 FL=1
MAYSRGRFTDAKQATLGLTLFLAAALVQAQPLTRESAVDVVRQGDTTRAIAQLRQLAQVTDDPRIRYDLIAILSWNEQDAQVTAVWPRMGSPTELPDYV